MKSHIQIVAALHIGFGALSLLAAIGLFASLGMAGGIVILQGAPEVAGILGIVAVSIGSFLTIISLPGIIGGWALLAGCQWGRTFVLVLGALQLINIPFGTALGIYTLWALAHEPQHS